MARKRPRQRLISALTIEPPERATTLARPKKTIAKNSGEEKRSARVATGLAIATISTAEIRPPMNAPTSDQPSAWAASPRRVMA